jgi:hypothetical protein
MHTLTAAPSGPDSKFYDAVVSTQNFSPFPNPVSILAIPDVSEILLRIKQIKILNAHEGAFSGKGEVYFISTLVDGLSEDPIKVVEASPWKDVQKNSLLSIFPPGIGLYHFKKKDDGMIPTFLDWRFLIMESDAGTRKAGDLMQELSSNTAYRGILDGVISLIAAGSPVSAILGLADQAFQFIGAILKANKDDFIAKAAVTYTRTFDNFGVPQGANSVILPSATGLYTIGDSAIQFEINLA